MGILRQEPEELRPIRIEDSLDDYVLDDSSSEASVEAASAPPSPRKRKERRHKAGIEAADGARRRPGQRKLRRMEHARLLSALVEGDVCEDLSDLLPDSASAFAQLFTERDCMQAWDAFVGSTEEEQAAVLAGDDAAASEGRRLGGHGHARLGHPAFTSEAAFARIDARLRGLLCHRQLPQGKVGWVERELVSFFSEDAGGVWVARLPSSFDRLLAHAVAQWLGLRSNSLELPGDARRSTQVENPRPFFAPPRSPLTHFLQQRREPPA